jgi:Ni,Fe-hydrogenase maturation factor
MDKVLTNTSACVLIIGYGNNLRGDDAVGRRVSDTIATWKLPNVQSLSVHQLTPELAETLASADFVIFVDAYPISREKTNGDEKSENTEGDIEGLVENNLTSPCVIVPLSGEPKSSSLGHTSNPSDLLALTQALYGFAPQASWLMVSGANFEFSESLSPLAERGIEIALQEIHHLIKTVRKEQCMKLE